MSRGPYLNEDGDWWVPVEDAPSMLAARRIVLDHLSYDVPEEGRLVGKERTSVCDAAYGDHSDPVTGELDPANCDEDCRRNVLAYHFEERRLD